MYLFIDPMPCLMVMPTFNSHHYGNNNVCLFYPVDTADARRTRNHIGFHAFFWADWRLLTGEYIYECIFILFSTSFKSPKSSNPCSISLILQYGLLYYPFHLYTTQKNLPITLGVVSRCWNALGWYHPRAIGWNTFLKKKKYFVR